MKIFKEIIAFINRTIVAFGFGVAVVRLSVGDYKIASWLLFGISILFMVGFFTERWSK